MMFTNKLVIRDTIKQKGYKVFKINKINNASNASSFLQHKVQVLKPVPDFNGKHNPYFFAYLPCFESRLYLCNLANLEIKPFAMQDCS